MSDARPPCPKCSHPQVSKNGHVQSVQRWKCRSRTCGYEFTRTTPRGEPVAKHALALLLYSMGRASYGIIARVLKATVSIRLGSGLIIHDCKIIQQDGALSAALPQRSERQKGGEVVYYDLVEFADPKTWPAIAPQLVAYYQAAHEEARGGGVLA